MAIPEDHLAKFYKIINAKETWEAIKSRFCGNDESKKMQKYLLKQQFESFYVSNLEGLHKGYDRFQSLLSQLETHGAGISTEDANQKFLRSLPSSRSQVSLIMRTKPGVDTFNFDDLYNNLRVFESDVKGSTGSSSSTQNVAFVSSDNTSSTNEVNTAYDVSTSSVHNSQKEGSLSYTNDLMYSFFVNQSSGLQLDHEDLEQVDEFDLEEMDLKWQVVMISTRLKKFYKKTGRKLHFDAKEPVGFDKSKVECFNCHNTGHFARECRSKGNQDNRRRDAGKTGYKTRDNGKRPAKWDEHKAMVTIDGEGVDWSGHAEDDTENYALMAFNSSNFGSDTELSAKDKSRLRYGSQIHDGVLSYENEVFASIFDSRSSDVENSPVNDRSIKVEGMHAVPPPMTGNYMPSKFDFRIDESNFTYGPKQSTTSESDAKTSDFDSCNSNSSVETLESVPKKLLMILKFGLMLLSLRSMIQIVMMNMCLKDNPHQTLKGKGIVDSGCSRHMTGNKAYLVDYQDFNGSHVAFGSSKGQITDTECLVLSSDFKLPDENQVLLRVPKQHNMYSFNLENIVPSGGLACLIAKVTVDKSTKWNIRMTIPVLLVTKESNTRPLPITVENKANHTAGPKETNNNAGTQDSFDARTSEIEADHAQEYYALPLLSSYTSTVKSIKAKKGYEKVYKNKKNERGVVVRNKARLVAQGHRQEEGIDYDEVFALVARIEAIRIFLAFASYMGFIVYQIDVKSTFLYGKIDEEVYVSQPLGFIDPKFPNKVYKVVKDLYGLHQASRAWYATLSTFLVQSRYKRGLIDKTLFINKDKKDIMLVQVYVDDIIFDFTKKSWCDEFEALMKNSVKTVNTHIKTTKPLVKDEEAVDVDVYLYRSMIGSLMYLTAFRPDI
nr:ribonuclease H-like domain-containing protein [Tanacetum cinerariifolium]